jgi:hypothetical protein
VTRHPRPGAGRSCDDVAVLTRRVSPHALAALAATILGGCAIGYHGRIGSADQKPHGVSAQLMYVSKYLAGVTVTSAEVRDTVSSEGRARVRYGVPLGVRVLDTAPGDIEGRVELWPFAGWILDGGAHGFEGGLHLRYQRLGYLVTGVQRTFGEHADTQGYLGFGVDLRSACSCF